MAARHDRASPTTRGYLSLSWIKRRQFGSPSCAFTERRLGPTPTRRLRIIVEVPGERMCNCVRRHRGARHHVENLARSARNQMLALRPGSSGPSTVKPASVSTRLRAPSAPVTSATLALESAMAPSEVSTEPVSGNCHRGIGGSASPPVIGLPYITQTLTPR